MKREEAIRIIETVFQDEYVYKYYDSITHQALDMAIEALKAQEWIPCSEQMPKTIGEYLITVQTKQSKKRITTAGYYHDRLKEFGTFRQDGSWEKWDVVAWKYKPGPYNAESEDKE